MRKMLSFLLVILLLSNMYCPAHAMTVQLSVHGLSFGMTEDEAKAILGEPSSVETLNHCTVYSFHPVTFSCIADGYLTSVFVEGRLSFILQAGEGTLLDYLYLKEALRSKYGIEAADPYRKSELTAIARMLFSGFEDSSQESICSYWEYDSSTIVLSFDRHQITIWYIGSPSEIAYDTEGL